MGVFAQDLRYATRQFRRSPGFYGVQPFDPWSASAALVLLLTIGIAAAAAPAFRAVRVDPASTLRQE